MISQKSPDLYSISYPQDRPGIKTIGENTETPFHCVSLIPCHCTVYSVFVLDVIQMIFASHTTWGYVISGWGNPAILFKPPWSLTAMTFISSLSEHFYNLDLLPS
jgi:hypothetical protein